MSGALLGKKVIVRSNEFINQDTNASIVMIGYDNKTILLELDQPLKDLIATYRHIVASPRLLKDSFSILEKNGTLGCSVTWMPDEKYDSSNPMDLSWWRGGAAAVADLYIN